MSSVFPTPDNALPHPSGDQALSPNCPTPLEHALASYAEGLECALPFNDLWAAIDAQLDADTLTNTTQQQVLLRSDDTLWNTYADSPEALEPENRQQLEHLLPNWPHAQQAICERQHLIETLRHYALRVENTCTFVANVHTLLSAPSFHTKPSPPLPLWIRTSIAVASIAALWVLVLDPTSLLNANNRVASGSSSETAQHTSLLATATTPSVESYVMTYCNDTSLTRSSASDTSGLTDEEMMDSEQVVLMGCGTVN